MQRINIDFEFECLKALAVSLWSGCDTAACQAAMRAAFQEGLNDGKLWIGTSFQFRISNLLDGNEEVVLPLSNRRLMAFNGHDNAHLYDALCIFDSALSSGVNNIYSSVISHSGYYFSSKADALCTKLTAEYGCLDIVPRDMANADSNSIVAGYRGCPGGEAGSYPTPEKFLKGVAEYNRDNQGLSLIRTFLSNIYSHGLYIAKEFNTRNLVLDLLPLYAQRESAINFDNGQDILDAVMNNPFVALTVLLEPMVFSSTSKYNESRANSNKGTPMTKEERLEYMRQLMDKIDAEAEAEDERINHIVSGFLASHPAPSLSGIYTYSEFESSFTL
jgi:hypothetical protein